MFVASILTGSVMYGYAALVIVAAAKDFLESSPCGTRSPGAGVDTLAPG